MKTFLLVLLFSLSCFATEKMERGIPEPQPNEQIVKLACGDAVTIKVTSGLDVRKVTVIAVCDK